MKLLNIILIIFIALTNEIKADSKNQLFEKLQKGGNLIFIRHAYAPVSYTHLRAHETS